MTTAHPIVPLHWIDELHTLNSALEAYHEIMSAWIQQALNGEIQGDRQTFVAGINLMFQPIFDGYRDIQSQIQLAKDLELKPFIQSEAS